MRFLFSSPLITTLVALVSGIQAVSSASVEPTNYFASPASAPYVSWLESRGVERFQHSTFLPSTSSEGEGVAVHWTIDDASSTIRLAVAAPATGWVGFGIAEAGGMPGSDIVYYEASTDSLTDSHVGKGYVAPTADSAQDWTLTHSQTRDGFIIFEAERALDTDDPQDRPIVFDGSAAIVPHRVIAAWGDSQDIGHHGNKRTRSALRFYPLHAHSGKEEDVFADEMASEAEGYFDLTIDNHSVTLEDTEYVDVCFTFEDLVSMGMTADVPLHIIGLEPIVDSAKHLHHIVAFASSYDGELETCDQEDLATKSQDLSMVYGYAPGTLPQELPDEAGIALGQGGYRAFFMNVHYDNRWKDEGVTDSSGVRVYYTSRKRKFDIGIMQLGDPALQLTGEPVGEGLTKHDFECPSSCTSYNFGEEITVYKEVLHMHETGVKQVNEVHRDGEVMRRAAIEYWDFDQSGLHEMQQDTFTMKPGDSIKTSCFFDTSSSKTPTIYGYGSQDEMCIAYLHYYPKQNLPMGICGANWFNPTCSASFASESIREVDRLFGMDLKAEPPVASEDEIPPGDKLSSEDDQAEGEKPLHVIDESSLSDDSSAASRAPLSTFFAVVTALSCFTAFVN